MTLAPPVPPQIAGATFALFYEDLFIGTAFGIAPLIAITTGHHIRMHLDDIGKLNLRQLQSSSSAAAAGADISGKENDPSGGGGGGCGPKRRGRLTPEEEEEKRKNIVAVASYAQKEPSSDVLVLWLDRKVSFYPLRAHHPPEGSAIMMVSAAKTPPHSDIVVSAGRVSRSPACDTTHACCRATGLVSARGYSGSVVIEIPDSSDTVIFRKAAIERIALPPRILGMHVSVYKNDNDPHAVNVVEFVSAYRILKMLCLYNVDPFSPWAQGKLLAAEKAKQQGGKKKQAGRSFY